MRMMAIDQRPMPMRRNCRDQKIAAVNACRFARQAYWTSQTVTHDPVMQRKIERD